METLTLKGVTWISNITNDTIEDLAFEEVVTTLKDIIGTHPLMIDPDIWTFQSPIITLPLEGRVIWTLLVNEQKQKYSWWPKEGRY